MKHQLKRAGTHRTLDIMVLAFACSAQIVASHAPSCGQMRPSAHRRLQAPAFATVKPVARVNGAVLTDRDLMREIQSIFPYAKMHNGIPKGMEPEMRKGALDMIDF